MSFDTKQDVDKISSDFEKAVARAEALSRAARQAAGISTKTAMEATLRAEQLGREAKEAAETAARAAQEAVSRAEIISQEARESADAAIKAAGRKTLPGGLKRPRNP
jgi:hypothetical protein